MTNPSLAAFPAPPLSAFPMVKSVEIKNFRGFEEFRVEGLAPINVIVGDNAVGKCGRWMVHICILLRLALDMA